MKEFRKPYKDGKCFYNHPHENHGGFFFRSFSMLVNRRSLPPLQGQSCWIETNPIQPVACSLEPVVTWIGHASFLVQLGGFNIIVDPVFGNVSQFYQRILPAGLTIDQLPRIDFIVISHNHRDHMDAPSLLAIKRRFPEATVMVPEGNKAWFDARKFARTYEQAWWSARSFPAQHDGNAALTITCLPAAHWSQRGLFDKNRSLWASWLLECHGYKIYFAGDTCYAGHFGEIAQTFPDINIALMPIGPHEPRAWLKEWHLGSCEAGQAFLDLGAQHMIPMHWGAFPFGVEQFDAPMVRIKRWWEENTAVLTDKQLHALKVGQTVDFGQQKLIE